VLQSRYIKEVIIATEGEKLEGTATSFSGAELAEELQSSTAEGIISASTNTAAEAGAAASETENVEETTDKKISITPIERVDSTVDAFISPSGLLAGEEYKLRRSQTLIDDPDARLNERNEIMKYFDRLEPSYRKELEAMNDLVGREMSESCRLTINIPAYLEGNNIYKTLEIYTNQKDEDGNPLDPNVFELVVLNNHPATVPEDQTQEEIEKFRQDHPEIKVIYLHKQWTAEEPATVGNARKYLLDISLMRNISRPETGLDSILVCNDADAIAVDEHYVSDILGAFKTNPDTDAFSLKWAWPTEALRKPNFYAANFVWDRLLHYSEYGLTESSDKNEPAQLEARNAAIRSGMYAAVGGFNPQAKNAEDLEMSWLIADARNWNPESVARLDIAQIATNPRRPLSALATGTPLNEMYMSFQSNPEIRTMDNDQLLAMVPDDLDLNLLEKELEGWYQARTRNEFSFLGPQYMPTFAKIMDELGIDFEIVDDHVKITSAERLLDHLSQSSGRNVEVVAQSEVKKTSPSEAKILRKYIVGTTYGFDDVRASKARELADRIDSIEHGKQTQPRDGNEIELLRKEYKRFTHEDYIGKDS